jgi:hypothetical protein
MCIYLIREKVSITSRIKYWTMRVIYLKSQSVNNQGQGTGVLAFDAWADYETLERFNLVFTSKRKVLEKSDH